MQRGPVADSRNQTQVPPNSSNENYLKFCLSAHRNVLYCVVPSICCSCSLVTRTSRAQRAQVLLKHSDVPFAEAILSCARLLLAKALLDPIRLVLMILT